MNELIENKNETVIHSQINVVLSLISIISVHYYVRFFSVVSEMNRHSFVSLQKSFSEFGFEIVSENITEKKMLRVDEKKAYLVLTNSHKSYLKIIKSRPKLIIAVSSSVENNSSFMSFLPELVIPSSTSFFAIVLSKNCSSFQQTNTQSCLKGKSFYIYKPISMIPSKLIPIFTLESNKSGDQKWEWETPGFTWNTLREKTRNMEGITITIALASHQDPNTTIKEFWAHRNSFFWRHLKDHLKFKAKVHVEHISPDLVKSITKVYMKLLMTNTDGLGVLPVISSERSHYLDYVLTGLDSRFHLMVRTPKFVHSWQTIFKPFTLKSWICLGIAIILISMTLRIIMYEKNLEFKNFFCCFFTIFGFVCCQGSPSIPNKVSARLVCFTALIFSFSIYQFYTSNFYSLLSTKEPHLPFTSIEQFLEKQTHSLYVHPDTAIYSQIMNAKNGTFKRLWEVLQRDPTHQLKSNEKRTESLEKVCKGKGAILGLPFQITSMRGLKCKLVAVNSGYFPTNVVTILKKRFPFKPQFKFVHLRLLEGGISHKYRDENLEIERKRLIKTQVTIEPVSLEHVGFLLAFLTASTIISLLILSFEIISFSKSSKILPRKK